MADGFKVEIDTAAFERGLEQMAREANEAAQRAVDDAMTDAGKEFAKLATVLTGSYRDSWVSLPAKETGKGKWEAQGGPDVPYAGKQEREHRTVEKAVEKANVTERLGDEVRKVTS